MLSFKEALKNARKRYSEEYLSGEDEVNVFSDVFSGSTISPEDVDNLSEDYHIDFEYEDIQAEKAYILEIFGSIIFLKEEVA